MVAGLVLAATLVVCAVVGFAVPHELAGAAAWSITVGGILWGYGGIARRVLRIELGIGEQMVLGTAAWIFASGVLLALGHASRAPLLVLAGVGGLLALAEL